jgi:hypothetical protein
MAFERGIGLGSIGYGTSADTVATIGAPTTWGATPGMNIGKS